MNVKSIDWLAELILARECARPLRLVAVDGRAGSGKSTLASKLAQRLRGAPLLPLDDFIAWDDLESFWPRLEEQVLAPLLQGRAARYQARDWERDPYGRAVREWKVLPFAPVIVVEGVGAARAALQERLACAVWVETRPELCLERGLQRDGAQSPERWLAWQERECHFFAADPVSSRASLVVSGEAPTEAHEVAVLNLRLG